jgi:beta-glucosidase
MPRHKSILKRVSEGNVDLVFLGDSITHHWTEDFFVGTGQEIWNEYYGHRNAVNMGFAGDDTCNVLWRLINGEVDGISPKLVVLMIGTNNTGDPQTIENIGDGVIAVVNTLRQKLPQAKVLLLGIFPRAENPGPIRDRIAKINQHASKVADGAMVHYLDIGAKFLNPDGTISGDIMPDYVHPSEKGYRIWADTIELKVVELMGE